MPQSSRGVFCLNLTDARLHAWRASVDTTRQAVRLATESQSPAFLSQLSDALIRSEQGRPEYLRTGSITCVLSTDRADATIQWRIRGVAPTIRAATTCS
jgi:hypothetical protein